MPPSELLLMPVPLLLLPAAPPFALPPPLATPLRLPRRMLPPPGTKHANIYGDSHSPRRAPQELSMPHYNGTSSNLAASASATACCASVPTHADALPMGNAAPPPRELGIKMILLHHTKRRRISYGSEATPEHAVRSNVAIASKRLRFPLGLKFAKRSGVNCPA